MVLTKRDIAKSVKTLLVMLQSLRNQQVTITLRNDSIVQGTVVEIDGDMNIELARATVKEDLFYCIQPNGNTTPARINPNKKARLEPQESTSMSPATLTKTDETQAADCGANKQVVEEDKDNIDYDDDDNEEEEDDREEKEGEDLSNTISHVYDHFIVKGSRVRHIDLPADCDMIASAKSEIERIRARRKQWTKRDIIVE